MPLLDLKCNQCEKEYEYSQYRSDDKPRCPYCNSEDYEKLISKNTSPIFKGSGFYVTDYKKRGR